MSWIEKYTPTTLDKVIGNKNEIEILKQLIVEDKYFLVYGEESIGKSNTVKIMLKNFNFNVELIDLDKNKKNAFEVLRNSLFSKRIDSYFSKAKKTAYLIDNMENIATEKELSNIVEIIMKKKLEKEDIILCITNNEDTIECFKKFQKIKFTNPSSEDIKRLITRIKNKENIKIGTYETEFLVKKSDFSFNKTINNIQQFFTVCGNKFSIKNLLDFHNRKEKNTNIKKIRQDTLMDIFNKKTTPIQCITKFNRDKSMIPMLVNDNYMVFFEKSTDSFSKKLILLKECSNFIMLGDICDKLIYNRNNWSDQYLHCLFSCYFPSRIINKLDFKKESIPSLNNSKTLGKYSRYRSNIKNINNLLEQISSNFFYNISDVQHISRIILYHLYDSKGDFETGVKLLKKYNMDHNYIDRLQKIDVLNSERYKIKNKNKIKKYFNP